MAGPVSTEMVPVRASVPVPLRASPSGTRTRSIAAQYSQAQGRQRHDRHTVHDVGVRMSGTGGSYNAYVVYTDGASGTLHTAIAKEVAGVGDGIASAHE
jgi:hypothetical protein